jgi:hypothetical protein
MTHRRLNVGRRTRIALALSLCGVAACTWQPTTRYELPVFSDDGEASAAIRLEYESRKGIAHDPERAHYSQVVFGDAPETSAPSPLTERLEGWAHDLFYMRSQGYLVLGRSTNNESPGEEFWQNDIWYDLIDLDGGITALGSGTFNTHFSCDGGQTGAGTVAPIRYIPSPDGTLLARFESETTCEERTIAVTLLNAADLSLAAGPFEVADPEPTELNSGLLYHSVDMGWTDSGAFAVGFAPDGGTEVFDTTLYRTDTEPTTGFLIDQDCFNPPTTSGSTNASGETLVVDEETGAIVIEPEESGDYFYDCD